LPWMARPHINVQRHDPELATYVREINAAIETRAKELREQTAAEQPTWTAGLGRRPTHPAEAAKWDELAGIAAAFRETYNITDNQTAKPLGPKPNTAGAKARAWQDITTRWRPPVSTSEHDQRIDNQRRIDDLVIQLDEYQELSPRSAHEPNSQTVDEHSRSGQPLEDYYADEQSTHVDHEVRFSSGHML
jgi:hypothetical protein